MNWFKRNKEVIGMKVYFDYLGERLRGRIVADTDEGLIIETRERWQYVVSKNKVEWTTK